MHFIKNSNNNKKLAPTIINRGMQRSPEKRKEIHNHYNSK